MPVVIAYFIRARADIDIILLQWTILYISAQASAQHWPTPWPLAAAPRPHGMQMGTRSAAATKGHIQTKPPAKKPRGGGPYLQQLQPPPSPRVLLPHIQTCRLLARRRLSPCSPEI